MGPLNQLLVLFMAPHKVMKKRYDKLLDYDNIQSRLKDLAEAQRKTVSVFLYRFIVNTSNYSLPKY